MASFTPDGSETQPDIDQAITFLKTFDYDGRHHLTAISPYVEGDITAKLFEPGEWAKMREWVAERIQSHNIYYSANEPKADAPDKKLSKKDIGSIRATWVDIDPDKGRAFSDERKRLFKIAEGLLYGGLPPSAIIDSGGGIQALWFLRKKLPGDENATRYENQNRGIASAIGGDGVSNIDRILRLPGTLNIPNTAKRAIGRAKAPARLLTDGKDARRYEFDEIAAKYEPVAPRAFGAKDTAGDLYAQAEAEIDFRTASACSSPAISNLRHARNWSGRGATAGACPSCLTERRTA
ncbi:MAG: hypothetical protein KDA48_15320 [Amphiplicatus sp.]|nr:hypothetical protein [Amphiplicatus sp.]